ncbi:signal recognition particle-docking protein FtsY, partial [Candidatus Dependentiae bacterium]|nr:signal recognition particle-docking protein FtsY [Candidatus Dependentiae bacterium]
MFGFIKDKLKKLYEQVTSKVSALFNRTTFDEDFLSELKSLLIAADVGVTTSEGLIKELRSKIAGLQSKEAAEVKKIFEELLIAQLIIKDDFNQIPPVVLMVGINGSGKTTFLAKLAHICKMQGKRVLLVAGDTF